jgi:hypothetical protein
LIAAFTAVVAFRPAPGCGAFTVNTSLFHTFRVVGWFMAALVRKWFMATVVRKWFVAALVRKRGPLEKQMRWIRFRLKSCLCVPLFFS